MPPKRDPPTIEEALASITEALTKLNTQLTENTTNPRPRDTPPSSPFPPFDGSNPLDWLFQADQDFTFYNIEPPRRLAMIAFHFSGDALSWYKYLFNNRLFTTWEAFTRALETRFDPSSYDNHQATLFKLCQTSTITTYQIEFKRLSNCVVGLTPQALLDWFISGLRHDIQQELTILRPQTITQAIGLAKLIEDKLHDQPLDHPKPIAYSSTSSQLMPTTQPVLDNPLSQTRSLPIKQLTPAEMQKRRTEGLCYNCLEKYQPGHLQSSGKVANNGTEDGVVNQEKSKREEMPGFTVYVNKRPTSMSEVIKDLEAQFMIIADSAKELLVMLEANRAQTTTTSSIHRRPPPPPPSAAAAAHRRLRPLPATAREKENYLLLLSQNSLLPLSRTTITTTSLHRRPPPPPLSAVVATHHQLPSPPTVGRRPPSAATAVVLPSPFSFFVRGFQDLKV
uniref:Retrotransposon gag domain-containing protein n=1 Tax=Tanacetum cinerariifolium TaxID=118510 RepID=A0A6L2N417_TANCI|nr:hypothetical protein [Tanacetum cinerariifolium]